MALSAVMNSFSAGTSESDIFRRQILTCKDMFICYVYILQNV